MLKYPKIVHNGRLKVYKNTKIVGVKLWKDVKSQSRLSLTTEAYDKGQKRP